VILAGGRSRRMGRDKAWIPVEGRPLVLFQAGRLSAVFDEVVVSAKTRDRFSAEGLRVVTDPETEFAPIFGIRAALAELGGPVFVLAVDLPRFPPALAAALARELVEKALPCVVPSAEGRIQALCAAYAPSILPELDARIAAGRLAIRELVAECGGAVRDETFWRRWGGPESFENWNRPEDHETVPDA
jgi:molybdopterin-guanine dinucleotide biosynthesis protein A